MTTYLNVQVLQTNASVNEVIAAGVFWRFCFHYGTLRYKPSNGGSDAQVYLIQALYKVAAVSRLWMCEGWSSDKNESHDSG